MPRRGHVVVISSIYAFFNGIGATPYAMSKAAVEQFGRALRVELVPHGASASVAYFGFIDTEMVRSALDGDAFADRCSGLPGRCGSASRRRSQARRSCAASSAGRRASSGRAGGRRSLLRGVLGPLADARRARRGEGLVAPVRRPGGEDQPTTA